jgi:hypothetical protein
MMEPEPPEEELEEEEEEELEEEEEEEEDRPLGGLFPKSERPEWDESDEEARAAAAVEEASGEPHEEAARTAYNAAEAAYRAKTAQENLAHNLISNNMHRRYREQVEASADEHPDHEAQKLAEGLQGLTGDAQALTLSIDLLLNPEDPHEPEAEADPSAP